jgi:hypothetical protein
MYLLMLSRKSTLKAPHICDGELKHLDMAWWFCTRLSGKLIAETPPSTMRLHLVCSLECPEDVLSARYSKSPNDIEEDGPHVLEN